MDDSPVLIRRREVSGTLDFLDDPEYRGVLLIGSRGYGKSAILYMVREELKRQGRAAFLISVASLGDPGDLGREVLRELATSSFAEDDVRTLRTSAGAPSLQETAGILRRLGARMSAPVLLLDDIDASLTPSRMIAALQELSLALKGWKFVATSQRPIASELGRFQRFAVTRIRELTQEESTLWIRARFPQLEDDTTIGSSTRWLAIRYF